MPGLRLTCWCWFDVEGAGGRSALGEAGDEFDLAAASLREAIETAITAQTPAPTSVRVASEELAARLRDAFTDLQVVCAPTPEIDTFAMFVSHDLGAPPYLGLGVEPRDVASFFRAAAELFRASPWTTVTSDQVLIAITSESLGLRDAALSVISYGGQYGVLLFAGREDFQAFIDNVDRVDDVDDVDAAHHAESRVIPPFLGLTFGPETDLGPPLRNEIAEYGWEVAGKTAFPLLGPIDAGMERRPVTARDLTIADAVARALCAVMDDRATLADAIAGSRAVSWAMSVDTPAGAVDVIVRAPYE